ncbi:MAG: class II aldolase/adducin family protein [Oscillospiraceae bacterium]|nr:class II aldolase/adducin family protein [Oscillospiraceae bacterium]
MLNDLKRAVCKANRELSRNGLVVFDWGSVSAFDMSMGVFVIKPSGVSFDDLQPELMVVMSMEGQKVEGRLEPEADVELHRAIYCSWAMQVGAVAHTHSMYATAFAQAGRPVQSLGTIHKRCFGADIPVTAPTDNTAAYDYAKGDSIVRAVSDPAAVCAALVHGHGPVAWGGSCMDAVENAVHLESVAKLAYLTETLIKSAPRKA